MSSKQTSLSHLEGVGSKIIAGLEKLNIHSTEELLQRCRTKEDRKQIAEKMNVPEKVVYHWANMADLSRIQGVAGEYSELLSISGVNGVQGLRTENPQELLRKMESVNVRQNLTRRLPSETMISQWIGQSHHIGAKLLEGENSYTLMPTYTEEIYEDSQFSWTHFITSTLLLLFFLWLVSLFFCFVGFFPDPGKWFVILLAFIFVIFSFFFRSSKVLYTFGCFLTALSLMLLLGWGDSTCTQENTITDSESEMSVSLGGDDEDGISPIVLQGGKKKDGGESDIVLVGGDDFEVNIPEENRVFFPDVKKDNIHRRAIMSLYDEGVITAPLNKRFRPHKTVQRSELVRMLVLDKNGSAPSVKEYRNCYADVFQEDYAAYICFAKEMGWAGSNNKEFRPTDRLLKAERVKMILEAYDIPVPVVVDTAPYTDVSLDAWYAPYIAAAKNAGLLEEDGKKFYPERPDTREKMIEMIYRTSKMSKK